MEVAGPRRVNSVQLYHGPVALGPSYGTVSAVATSGRAGLGFALALITSLFWGVLPIVLKIVLQEMDPYTITWCRFAVSGVVLGGLLAATGRLPVLAGFARAGWGLLAIALVGLVGNYVLYLVALTHSTPAINQTVVQLSPLFLLLGGLVIYRESFSGLQWTGLTALVAGLLLFFNRRLPELLHPRSGLGLGVVLIVIATLSW
ncbi:MAG: DMT family transporter, partial [Acidobacteriota bacterium]